MSAITLPHGFYPRDYQFDVLEALDSGFKRIVWIVHRRAGKDLTIFNWIIKELACGSPKICWYIFPEYGQAKRVIWDGLTKDGRKYLSYIPAPLIAKKHEKELKIEFTNGSIFQLIGSDNYDSLVGAGPSFCVFSEAALHDPRAWQYIRPMIRETNGVAIFISTPRGKNFFYENYIMAKSNPEWWTQVLTVEDTKAITIEDVESERRSGMSEEMIQQEYYCSFDSSIEGAFYARILSKLRKDGHIQKVSYNEDLLVYTAWDLGFTDSTCIVFFQLYGEHIRIIDYYESHGYRLAHYLELLASKPYVYGMHFAPHDGKAHDRAGSTFIEKAAEFGYDFTVLERERTILEGIELVRSTLPRCYFDEEKCSRLVQCLENYHAELDNVKQVYSRKPDHDWSSHGSDAFRYACNSLVFLQESRGDMTPEKLQELRFKGLARRDAEITPPYKRSGRF